MTDQRSPEEIRVDIERTREELAETAAALAQKADVKARAQERMQEISADVRRRVDGLRSSVSEHAPESAGGAAERARTTVRANPVPAAVLVGVAVGFLIARSRHD